MISIESSGKTVREAIEDGLKKLGKSLGEVEVKILSQGGLLRKAKVQITVSGSEAESGELNIDYLGPKRQRTEEENELREKRYQSYSESVKIPDDKEQQKPQKPQNSERDGFRRNDKPQRNDRNDSRSDSPRNGQRNERGDNSRSDSQRNERPQRSERPYSKERPQDSKSGYAKKPHGHSGDSDHKSDNYKSDNYKSDNRQDYKFKQKREESFSTLTDEAKEKALGFLSGTLNGMGIEHTLESKVEDNQLNLSIVCESGAAIGYRGETLAALEYLTCLCTSRGNERYKVAVDCNGYREKREQSLVALAERMAAKAIKTGRKVVLEPMSSPSRKVIHSALSENDKLITRSEGSEPNRRIVIIPKRQRNNDRQEKTSNEMNGASSDTSSREAE